MVREHIYWSEVKKSNVALELGIIKRWYHCKNNDRDEKFTDKLKIILMFQAPIIMNKNILL